MAYTGFNFRQTLAYVTDPVGTVWAGATASSYQSVASGGTGYGWTGALATLSNRSTLDDPRIAGNAQLNSGSNFRIDVPNGTYDVLMGILGNTTTLIRADCKLKVGAGTVNGVDQFIVDSLTASLNNSHVMDASGNIWTPASAWPINQVALRVTVTQGFFLIQDGPQAISGIAHFAYQEVVTPYADGVLTDDTHTSGTTPKLMEAQPDQKVLGFLDFPVGSSVDTNYSVTLADGVTPDPYLTLRTINGALAICYNGTRHPGTGPTRTFYVTQTDKVPGKHPNSPYIQAITLNVVAAPTKPFNDGTVLSKISTGAFLLRKKITDQFTGSYSAVGGTGEWRGYQGQSFVQTITVFNTAGFLSAMNTLKAQAGANKWFCIEIDQDGTSDWATAGVIANGNPNGDWLFKPELGGGCLVRYKATGAKPLLLTLYPRCPRGVHIDGITLVSDGTIVQPYLLRYDSGVSASGDIALIKITNCKLGIMWNPANSTLTESTIDPAKTPAALYVNGVTEQAIITDNQFFGVGDSIIFQGRMLHAARNDITYNVSDCFAMGAIGASAAANYPDSEQYLWIENNTNRVVANTNNPVHSDWYQQRTSTSPGGTVHVLIENNIAMKAWDNVNVGGSVTQVSDTVNIESCSINNIFACVGPRGIDLNYGAYTSYAEFNSFGPPKKMIPNNTQYEQQGLLRAGAAGVTFMKGRKNITTGVNSAVFGEDEVIYKGKVTDGIDPNTKMNGPFIVDPTWNAAGGGIDRYISQVNDDPKTISAATFTTSMLTAFTAKPGIDAGAQLDGIVGTPGTWAPGLRMVLGLSLGF